MTTTKIVRLLVTASEFDLDGFVKLNPTHKLA